MATIYSWQDLRMIDVEVPPDVVGGFIPGSSLVMFSGDGGIGKSYILLEMALQIAQGLPWLGMETTKCPILIIDLENRLWRAALRVKYISRGWTLREGADCAVSFVFECDVDLSTDEGTESLCSLIGELGVKLVILDSLVDFLDGLDENNNTLMASVCKRLRQAVDRTGATILAIHHVAKTGAGKSFQSSRGASALKDNVDTSIQVVRSGDGAGNLLTMRHDKARDFTYKSIKALLNWDNHEQLFNTTLFGVGDAKDSTSGDSDEQAILDCLSKTGWAKRSEAIRAAQRVTGSSEPTFTKKIRRLIDDGLVLEDPKLFGRSTGIKLA